MSSLAIGYLALACMTAALVLLASCGCSRQARVWTAAIAGLAWPFVAALFVVGVFDCLKAAREKREGER